MFNFLKRNHNGLEIYAPVTGNAIDLENVPDKVFASKMMGDGLAFSYTGNVINAPCSGTVLIFPNMKHAFGIKTKLGVELLVHIGLDTVHLNGEGFKVLVQNNQKVRKGESIIQLDRQLIESHGVNLITPMVLTNSNEFTIVHTKLNSTEVIAGKTCLIEVKKK